MLRCDIKQSAVVRDHNAAADRRQSGTDGIYVSLISCRRFHLVSWAYELALLRREICGASPLGRDHEEPIRVQRIEERVVQALLHHGKDEGADLAGEAHGEV